MMMRTMIGTKMGERNLPGLDIDKTPNYQELCDFVLRAGDRVMAACIVTGSLQAGISNAMDGSEDDRVKLI
jgi:hypothetical protein